MVVKCEHCEQEREIVSFGGVQIAKLCSCEKAVKERENENQKAVEELFVQMQDQLITSNMRDSGIPKRFATKTFETYQVTDDNKLAYLSAREYVENFEGIRDDEKNGLILLGPMGVGKTHLSSAIANELIVRGVKVMFLSAVEMLRKIKDTYHSTREASEWDIISEYSEVDLLIIDDLGKENPTEWTVSLIYSIVNERYENMLPLVMTLNYGSKELVQRMTVNNDSTTADAIVDRIFEMCKAVVIKGKSWRRRND